MLDFSFFAHTKKNKLKKYRTVRVVNYSDAIKESLSTAGGQRSWGNMWPANQGLEQGLG